VSGKPDVVQVQVAHDDRQKLLVIVRELLSRRLIACGQIIGPVESHYWWQGRIEKADEWLALCKTSASAASHVIEAIEALHDYDVPEIVAVPIVGGLGRYVSWIAETVAS
jgi:periplasmic divalent cation tolerance protein